jgi:hypothetical protein
MRHSNTSQLTILTDYLKMISKSEKKAVFGACSKSERKPAETKAATKHKSPSPNHRGHLQPIFSSCSTKQSKAQRGTESANLINLHFTSLEIVNYVVAIAIPKSGPILHRPLQSVLEPKSQDDILSPRALQQIYAKWIVYELSGLHESENLGRIISEDGSGSRWGRVLARL